ncbi:ribosomal maturation YjgA family protein [Flavobacterium endoglycinae]|nr:DUF2809 domain-containing protein [Flavobacterium endoglycinae]
MIYILIRVVFPSKKVFYILLFSALTCYSIEFLQLYEGQWMIELRKTFLGRYVLGQGFLWSDIVAYTFGILFIFSIERLILKYHNHETRFCIKQ